MKRLALLLPLLALVAGCVSARRDAAEPALSVRLVRFSAWAADGAARDGAGSLSAAAIDLAGFAPTNACEATFAVAAAGGAIVTGFAEGSFELLEADGKEILRSEPELSDLAVDLASRIEAAADSVAGVKTRSKSVRVYSSSSFGSFRADAGTTVRIVNFKKPAADEMTVVFVHPADPARVPAEF